MEGRTGPPDSPSARARAELDAGPAVSWAEESRFGRLGLSTRSLLQRALKPYLVRRRVLDEALVEALELMDRKVVLERRAALAAPLPDGAIELETDLGMLWLDETDTILTPLVREHRSAGSDLHRLLEERLRPGSVFVDVGASVGYFSVLASSLVGRAGLVVALEPDARSAALLRANLWRHGCANAMVVPAAAAARTGFVSLVANEAGRSGSWIDERLDASDERVPACALDDLLGESRVDVLKIDVEGREPLVIQGAERLIAASPSLTIVSEFWPYWPEPVGGLMPREALDYYERLGFALGRLEDDGTVAASSAEALVTDVEQPLMNIVLERRPSPDG